MRDDLSHEWLRYYLIGYAEAVTFDWVFDLRMGPSHIFFCVRFLSDDPRCISLNEHTRSNTILFLAPEYFGVVRETKLFV